MQIKEFVSKGAAPFLLGVVVTVAVSSMTTPCCEETLLQNRQEIINAVRGLQKDVSKQTRALNKSINTLPGKIVAASKPAPAPAKAAAPVKPVVAPALKK